MSAPRPLTDQMRYYLAAMYWCGSVQGFRFGSRYDSTRKALVKRGLLSRTLERRGARRVNVHRLTEGGAALARELPDPRRTAPSHAPQRARLEEVGAGRW